MGFNSGFKGLSDAYLYSNLALLEYELATLTLEAACSLHVHIKEPICGNKPNLKQKKYEVHMNMTAIFALVWRKQYL